MGEAQDLSAFNAPRDGSTHRARGEPRLRGAERLPKVTRPARRRGRGRRGGRTWAVCAPSRAARDGAVASRSVAGGPGGGAGPSAQARRREGRARGARAGSRRPTSAPARPPARPAPRPARGAPLHGAEMAGAPRGPGGPGGGGGGGAGEPGGADRAAGPRGRRGLRACGGEFACPELEALFRGYALRLEQAAALKALAVLSLLAGALALGGLLGARGPARGLAGGSPPVHCVLFLALLAATNVRALPAPRLRQVGRLALLLSLTFALLCCPFPPGAAGVPAAGAADQGVWQLLLVTFVAYALLPVGGPLAAGFGLVVAASHLLVTAALVPARRPRLWRTVSAGRAGEGRGAASRARVCLGGWGPRAPARERSRSLGAPGPDPFPSPTRLPACSVETAPRSGGCGRPRGLDPRPRSGRAPLRGRDGSGCGAGSGPAGLLPGGARSPGPGPECAWGCGVPSRP